MQKSSLLRAIGLAWLVAGCLDITSAIVIWTMRGVPLTLGFQGIAGGLVGRETAIGGSAATAALGFVLHFFIMFCVVMVFYLASRFIPALIRRPIPGGVIYGLVIYVVMYWIVVPLSRIGSKPHSFSNDATAILIHILLIGLPIALIMHHFSRIGTKSGS
jgi:hypothetical protein